jgi:transcriptional regulator of acetoin/glycerol metabolism
MIEAKPQAAAARAFGAKVPPLVTEIADVAVTHEFRLELLVEAIEREVIRKTLVVCKGNVSRAAQRLGIHRNTLQRRIEQWGL